MNNTDYSFYPAICEALKPFDNIFFGFTTKDFFKVMYYAEEEISSKLIYNYAVLGGDFPHQQVYVPTDYPIVVIEYKNDVSVFVCFETFTSFFDASVEWAKENIKLMGWQSNPYLDVRVSGTVLTALTVPGQQQTSLEIPDTVTGIAPFAFRGSKLMAFEAKSWLERIGERAFQNLTSLATLNLQESSVNLIDEAAFASCTYLNYVVFPRVPVVINKWAFAHCSALSDIENAASIEMVGPGAFQSTKLKIFYGSNVTVIGASSFKGCKELTDVYLPKISSIPSQAFEDSFLEVLHISNKIKMIDPSAFRGCQHFHRIEFDGIFEEFESVYNYPKSSSSQTIYVKVEATDGAEAVLISI